jgi:hypothetical protein
VVLFLQSKPAPILQGLFEFKPTPISDCAFVHDELGYEFLLYWKSRSIWPTGGGIRLSASGKIGEG